MPNPPKPAALKLLQGNPGKRPILEEPQPDTYQRAPAPPRHLPKLASYFWRRHSRTLFSLGLLTKADISAYEAASMCYARYREAESYITEKGLVLEVAVTDKKGDLVGTRYQKNPATDIAIRERVLLKQYMEQFGLTPSARVKLGTKPKPKVDPAKDLIGRGRDLV